MAVANGDLAAKYQRLATEYAKLKAQIPVLKKAVIDEQTKVSGVVIHLFLRTTSIFCRVTATL